MNIIWKFNLKITVAIGTIFRFHSPESLEFCVLFLVDLQLFFQNAFTSLRAIRLLIIKKTKIMVFFVEAKYFSAPALK